MAKQYENRYDRSRISDEMWNAMEPLLPPPKPHSLDCHRPRLDNRLVLNMIFLVLRTGMQGNALNATGICSCTPAYQRFREAKVASSAVWNGRYSN